MSSRILLVDDGGSFLDIPAPFLERAGFLVETTGDGGAALQRVAESAPDVIVLDVVIPHVDGRKMWRRLRRAGNWTLAIVLTRVGGPTERAMSLEEGAEGYINRPFDPGELVARIRAVLRRAQAGQRLDGQCYGIEGATAEIKAEVVGARCQPGLVIRARGHLKDRIPDSYGWRIVAERVEVEQAPPTPTPEQGPGQTQVGGGQGRVIPFCGREGIDRYFERQDGVCFGIAAEAPSVKNELYIAEGEDCPVRVWGALHRGVDDYRGARIVVERLEH